LFIVFVVLGCFLHRLQQNVKERARQTVNSLGTGGSLPETAPLCSSLS
jgi:hypothetical protein